jgi:ribosomal protein L37AE/L43A
MSVCPRCHGIDTRRATVYWQCMTCGSEWADAPLTDDDYRRAEADMPEKLAGSEEEQAQ